MESSGTGTSGGPGAGGSVGDRVSGALEDLRRTAESAGGDVRARIDEAVDQIRDATGTMQARAEEARGELQVQLESIRDWVREASVDLLDELQKEIDKRRAQLTGSGDSGPSAGSGGAGTGSGGSGAA